MCVCRKLLLTVLSQSQKSFMESKNLTLTISPAALSLCYRYFLRKGNKFNMYSVSPCFSPSLASSHSDSLFPFAERQTVLDFLKILGN